MDPTSDMCFKFALNYFRADLMQNVTSSLEQVMETISVLDFLSCLEKLPIWTIYISIITGLIILRMKTFYLGKNLELNGSFCLSTMRQVGIRALFCNVSDVYSASHTPLCNISLP